MYFLFDQSRCLAKSEEVKLLLKPSYPYNDFRKATNAPLSFSVNSIPNG